MAYNQVLVTGGLGYIGSHTVVELYKNGYQPVIVDNLSNSDISVIDAINTIIDDEVEFRAVELCDLEAIKKVLKDFPDIQSVIHFAAILVVNESVNDPLKYYDNNLRSTINLLTAMKDHGINPIVFSSSCTVYGNPDTLPVAEDSAVKPAESPYGNTKKISEEIIRDSCSAYDINAISLRYFNPIGAHPSARIGEVQAGVPHHLVPFITETAKGKREVLTVFGDDYNTRDGSCIRDFIHVLDVADAHINALKRLLDQRNKSCYEFFNIGSGNGYTIFEMIKAFEETTGIKVNHTIGPRRAGDVESVYADISLARKELKWEPKRSLHDMLQTAWDWEQKQ